MGYTTKFKGQVAVTPPLNPVEIDLLDRFADSRRHQRPEGPYSFRNYAFNELDGNAYNTPHDGQPGLWCDWEATEDGTGIRWNGAEKTYYATAWVQYLIDHFLKPDAHAKGQPGFEQFTFDHTVNGVIHAQGDEPGDTWDLTVVDNVATGESPR
ncbi:hypothetical protein ACFVGN_38770 [Streptomyces sp. NPDC057757]|uniref:hypothetical protein n=1 Tax=Streptomyces sp. NPDC057757 TaxID=3346241 RepID=UPI0036B4BE1A